MRPPLTVRLHARLQGVYTRSQSSFLQSHAMIYVQISEPTVLLFRYKCVDMINIYYETLFTKYMVTDKKKH